MPERTAKAAPETAEDLTNRDPAVWVDLHGDAMYRFAILRVKDPSVAEDLIQDTFLSAIKAVDNFRGGSSVRTWLIGILKRKIIDYYRKSTKEIPASDLTVWEEDDDTVYFDHDGHWKRSLQEWSETPEELVVNQEFWKTFRSCLSGLPDSHRRAFTLREVDGVDSEEICKILSITSSNLWVMLHRARSKLRKCLDATWFHKTAQETE